MTCPNCKKDAGTAKFCPECWALVYLETELLPPPRGISSAPENHAVFEQEPPPLEPFPVPAEYTSPEPVYAKPAAPETVPLAKTLPSPAGTVPAGTCPNCNGLLVSNATFCGKCGAQTGLSACRPMQSSAPPQPPAPGAAQTGCMGALAVVGGFAALVLICCFALFG